jgi:hypothetical protein
VPISFFDQNRWLICRILSENSIFALDIFLKKHVPGLSNPMRGEQVSDETVVKYQNTLTARRHRIIFKNRNRIF